MFKWKYDPQNLISLFGVSAIAWMLYVATPEKHVSAYWYNIPHPQAVWNNSTIFCSNAAQNGTTTIFYTSTTSGGSVLWGQGYACSIITK
jgi:hypothetical protein